MTLAELQIFLGSRSNEEVIDRDLFGRRPWLFPSDETFARWRASLASALDILAADVVIVGSAATGFSLSPLKPGRPFRSEGALESERSDVDIAFVSPNLFLAAWNEIIYYDRTRRLGWDYETRVRVRQDVYWGLVSDSRFPRNTDAARMMSGVKAIARRDQPVRGHEVRCRVYRRHQDLRAYHIASLRDLRSALSAALEDVQNGQQRN